MTLSSPYRVISTKTKFYDLLVTVQGHNQSKNQSLRPSRPRTRSYQPKQISTTLSSPYKVGLINRFMTLSSPYRVISTKTKFYDLLVPVQGRFNQKIHDPLVTVQGHNQSKNQSLRPSRPRTRSV